MTKPSAKFEFFREITPICHPALSCVEAFVRALCLKDEAVLHACFAQDPHTPFLDTLPGGVQVRSAAQLSERHREFFAHPDTAVQSGALQEGMGNADLFVCSVPVAVTLPDLSIRRMYIDMTFIPNAAPGPAWVPIRLSNTVIDPAQVALP